MTYEECEYRLVLTLRVEVDALGTSIANNVANNILLIHALRVELNNEEIY